jgi:hypothetical protein
MNSLQSANHKTKENKLTRKITMLHGFMEDFPSCPSGVLRHPERLRNDATEEKGMTGAEGSEALLKL